MCISSSSSWAPVPALYKLRAAGWRISIVSGPTDGGGTSLTPCTRVRRGATYVRYRTHRHRLFNRSHALLVVDRRDRIHTCFLTTLKERRIFLVMLSIPENIPRTSTGSVPTRESGPSPGLKRGDNVLENALSLLRDLSLIHISSCMCVRSLVNFMATWEVGSIVTLAASLYKRPTSNASYTRRQ